MNVKVLSVAALAFIGVSLSANAQSQFAGSYDLIAGYSRGWPAGLFGYGVATAARNGNVSYSSYYAYLKVTGRGTGRMNNRGVFALNNGVTGSARLLGNRVAVGNFRDSEGRGFFALRKR
jgi:hypothetical protein